MSYLIYVNGLGPDYKGNNLYEFIFSDEMTDVWGPSWDSYPSNGYPSPPDLKHIKKVGTLKNTDLKFELIQNSDYLGMSDAMDGVIALSWEVDEDGYKNGRLVFRFGEDEKEVKNKLYERDLVLEFEKNTVYEI
jgi:hypothetical protein